MSSSAYTSGSLGRKRLGPAKATKSAGPFPPAKRSEPESQTNTPRKRGRKFRKIVDDSQPDDDAIQEAIQGEIQDEMVMDSHVTTGSGSGAGAAANVEDSNHTSGHTNASFVLEPEPAAATGAGVEAEAEGRIETGLASRQQQQTSTPTRASKPRHRSTGDADHAAESSPLSTPKSERLEYPVSDYENDKAHGNDTQSISASGAGGNARQAPRDRGDDEYTGESWTDSHGARHHGGGTLDGLGTGEDTDDEELVTPRRRRRPARYID